MAAQSGVQIKWCTVTCGTCTYTLPNRYQEICPIGKGTFSAVIRAKDTETGQSVAIIKLFRPFHNPDRAKQTYRELKLLMYLYHPDIDIIQLYNVFTPEKNVDDFSTLYFVFNFVDYNLRQVIKRDKPFSEDHIKQIICSLLRALKYIHSAGIIQRDLKPENIGIDQDSNVAIKLILLKPIFPGEGHLDQLDKIFDIIGTPDITTLHELATEEAREYISRLKPKPKQDFNRLFGFQYDSATNERISGVLPKDVDLLDRLLSFDPRRRPTAQEALTIIWKMVQDFVPPQFRINDNPNPIHETKR
ncbi:unnamed protein product [Rotaria sordida]|uniref:Protein kinase domain-containing protein n=1 Tax=Rotaria sordida TaxID=392033 RepID=A0A815UUH3_9BILA|nr:unnamed protein product [Rotaria sordida]CAF1520807.1 unnamed protein product [Rotaria sordida]